MNIYDQNTIILAIVGMLGVLSTGVVMTYSFIRNRNDNQKFQ